MIPHYTKFCDGCQIRGTGSDGMHFVNGDERRMYRRGGVGCKHDFCDACEADGVGCNCAPPQPSPTP